MKKLLTILIALLVLVGCGTSGGDGAKPVVLTLWDENQLPVIQENVDRFNEEYEGEYEATIELVPWSNYWEKLDASLETGESADVMWMNVYLPKYVDGGVLEPLDSFIENENFDLGQYVAGRVETFEYKDSLWALPKGLDSVFVAYNKDIFTKYDVAEPQDGWTWDDMRAIAAELRDAIAAENGSEYPIVMELDAQPSYVNFLTQNGGYYLSDDWTQTGIGLPESIDAIQQVVDLMDQELMAPYAVLSETQGTDLFVSGHAGIVFIGSWKAAVLEDSTLGNDGNIGLIQMPSMAENNHSVAGGLGYVMASNSENKEGAWELIKFLTNEESMAYEAERGIDFPAHIAAQPKYVESFKNIDATVITDASLTAFPYPSNGNFEWPSTVDDAIQVAFSGLGDVEEVLTEAHKTANEQIEAAGISR